MKLAISGANGYVGKFLSNYFISAGYSVSLFSSRAQDKKNYFSLADTKSLPDLDNYEALIILSYSKDYNDLESALNLNLKGTIQLIEGAKRSGIQNIIYVSSMSAFDGCKSIYGNTKLEIEKYCLSNDVKVIKPGLIFSFESSGGTFGSLLKIANLFPILPKFSDSVFQYLVHEVDLCEDIINLLQNKFEPTAMLSCYTEPIRFNNLLKKISKYSYLLMIPFNLKLTLFILNFFENIGFKIGPGADSLRGLCNPYPYPVLKYKNSYLADYNFIVQGKQND